MSDTQEVIAASFDVSRVDRVELINHPSDVVYVYPEFDVAERVLRLRLLTSHTVTTDLVYRRIE